MKPRDREQKKILTRPDRRTYKKNEHNILDDKKQK